MRKRILVVEDQQDNRQIIRDMLAPVGNTCPKPGTDSVLRCRSAYLTCGYALTPA